MWSRSHGFPLLRHSTPWKQAKQTQCNDATPDRNTTLDFYCWGFNRKTNTMKWCNTWQEYNPGFLLLRPSTAKQVQYNDAVHNWNTMVDFHCCSIQLPKTKPNNYNNYEAIHNGNNSHEFPQPRHLIAQNHAKQYQSIGRFSEAGLLEWMCFVIFCARSCERLQCTSGLFLHTVYTSGSWT